MKELFLPPELSCEIGEIYDSMATAYDEVARAIPLTCTGLPGQLLRLLFPPSHLL
jgi:hypothetical protein